MAIFEEFEKKLQANPKSIVFTEGTDARILSAASKLLAAKTLKVILLGEVEAVKKAAADGGFDITGADTLLAGGHTSSRRNLLSGEIWLQRSHTGIDQQQAVVIMWHQRETLHCQMTFAFKKIQILFTKFVYTIFFHGFRPFSILISYFF